MEKIVELTKKVLTKDDENTLDELKNELNKCLMSNIKLSKIKEICENEKFDLEKYEFMLKLISNDKELYDQIKKLEELKKLEKEQQDLEVLEENIKETSQELKEQLKNFNENIKRKTKKSLIKQILTKRKNKKIIKEKCEKIINIIDNSKQKRENKNLKEEYFEKEGLNEELELLYEYCKIQDIRNIQSKITIIRKKYDIILKKIDKNKQINSEKIKEKNKEIKNFDKRLYDYVFQKKNNYVTFAIGLSKKDLIHYDNKTNKLNFKEPNKKDAYELYAYTIIALYLVNKNEFNETRLEYKENKSNNPKQNKTKKPNF